MATLTGVVTLAFVLFVCIIVRLTSNRRRRGRIPPGPWGWPFIGNALDVPNAYAWKAFAKWSKNWGDIMMLNLLGQRVMILNSPSLAFELLDKKSAVYSGRPAFPVITEIMGWERETALRPYGPALKELRKLITQTIGNRTALLGLSTSLEHEALDFLCRVMSDPKTLRRQVDRYTTASILRITYGYNIKEDGDELVNVVKRAVETLSLASAPGAYLADVFPILTRIPAWFPGAGWKRQAQAWRVHHTMMYELPFKYSKQQLQAGTLEPCFVSKHLEDCDDPEREALIADAASSIFAGMWATTIGAILAFFLAMTCFPEKQKKVQDEIDNIIGNDRLPCVTDLDRLPNVKALCWEVLRWHAIFPLGKSTHPINVGAPHRLTEDDVHAGYFIPKGTTVFTNIWAMLRDHRLYSKPEEFNPDRFVPSDGSEPEYDPRQICFGFGRRICPGMQFAEMSLSLVVAMTLSVFNISKPVVNGKVVEPSLQFAANLISHPLPFECDIRPRSAKAAALLSSALDGRA
ncbi:cytochrome P450 [Fomitopsis serialis]|uniref:cytochrome P450 n=1 Tax=Fomitopsis serialis TaxID=139415 RepID=UPI0020086D81|nr:cytochrome P450 [Neoantrodia serialis]KAH9937585.1 cytochrome P450 [Neoantrodia serialis]